jgi:hypothetical protein
MNSKYKTMQTNQFIYSNQANRLPNSAAEMECRPAAPTIRCGVGAATLLAIFNSIKEAVSSEEPQPEPFQRQRSPTKQTR